MDSSENEKVWEKCARLLMLNSILKLDVFLETVVKIVECIHNAPTVLKFRTLKYSNTSIANKVVEVCGGVEYFHAIGFKTVVDAENGKVLQLCLDFNSESRIPTELATLENLNIGVQWLKNTISTCRVCAASCTTRPICAECTIVIRLPTGASVSGGFMRGDKLHHVRSYACCFFTSQRYEKMKGFWLQLFLSHSNILCRE